jgi:hypothetical protein
MKRAIVGLAAASVLSGGPVIESFTGVITDSECANGDHSGMRMGSTDAGCTVACVDAHGADYVLSEGTKIYRLSDQRTPEKFAGKKVTVTGTLDTRSGAIQVDSITAAP